jgi:uncharacterized protein (TIGR02246 family)
MRRLTIAVLPLAFLTACQPAATELTERTELTEEQKAAIVQEVKQMQDDYWEAWNDLDLGRFLWFYADDVLWGTPDGTFITMETLGGPELREWMSTLVTETNVVTDDISVRVLGPDAAVVALTTRGRTVYSNGTSTDDRTALTVVWARVDGAWKIVHGSYLPITAPMQPSDR